MNNLDNKTKISLKKHILKLLQTEKYDQLRQDIAQKEEEGLNIPEFFDSEQGFSIFHFFVSTYPNSKPMAFICNLIPKTILDNFLTLKNNLIVKHFLAFEGAGEELKIFDEERKIVQVEKFKMLLRINAKFMTEFIQKMMLENSLVTKTIQENFEIAQKSEKN